MDKNTVKKYLSNPDCCPHCDSGNISAGHFDEAFNQYWRVVECQDCNKKWSEIFTLTDVAEND